MPNRKATLPDGRQVGYNTKVWKEYRHSLRSGLLNTDVDGKPAKVVLSAPPPPILSSPGDVNIKSFTPPPDPIGEPKGDYTIPSSSPKKRGKTKKEEKADELEDVKQLVAAIFAGVAVIAGSDLYRFSEPECEAVAKPLARIIDRYSGIKKAVQQVADPIALFSAIAFPLAVKAGAHKLQQMNARQQQVAQAPVVDVRTMQQSTPPPPPPSSNGHVPFNSVLDRISEGS
jgi:hypothetical protein